MIIYCLDNSFFCQADGDGIITQIVKLAYNKFHVGGEIIVAHEITMAAAVANLKRILAVCGDRKVLIITPLLRYINGLLQRCGSLHSQADSGLCHQAALGPVQAAPLH